MSNHLNFKVQENNMSKEQETNDKKTTLLTDETFSILRSAQRRIQEETDFSPSLRLLINDVINNESVNQATDKLIDKIKNSALFDKTT